MSSHAKGTGPSTSKSAGAYPRAASTTFAAAEPMPSTSRAAFGGGGCFGHLGAATRQEAGNGLGGGGAEIKMEPAEEFNANSNGTPYQQPNPGAGMNGDDTVPGRRPDPSMDKILAMAAPFAIAEQLWIQQEPMDTLKVEMATVLTAMKCAPPNPQLQMVFQMFNPSTFGNFGTPYGAPRPGPRAQPRGPGPSTHK